MWSLIEVYRAPNYSPAASVVTIAIVASGWIVAATLWLLSSSFEPLQSDEDSQRLSRLRETDKAAYDAVINSIAAVQVRRPWFLRWLPVRMPRIPEKKAD